MSNPYQTPQFDDRSQFAADGGPAPRPSGKVQQVRVFAALNGVQGGLEVAMGLMLLAFAALFPLLLENDPNMQRLNNDGRSFQLFMTVLYGGLGIAGTVCGALRLMACFKNWNFRGRGLGMISIFAGMGSCITCYCAPTAIAVLVYGLILYLDPYVKDAFAHGEQGVPADKILYDYSAYRPTT
ncbi:MAG: hypothetical protein KDA41_07000 [Planctomycetales bacterium]|nr:hypothetical protein [Planctomycetales bacterium]